MIATATKPAVVDATTGVSERCLTHTRSTAAIIVTPTMAPIVRWLYSIKAWYSNGGIQLPKHVGQSGHPSPDPVTRTALPMVIWIRAPTTLASSKTNNTRSRQISAPRGVNSVPAFMYAPATANKRTRVGNALSHDDFGTPAVGDSKLVTEASQQPKPRKPRCDGRRPETASKLPTRSVNYRTAQDRDRRDGADASRSLDT